MFEAILAQRGIQAPGLSFRSICHPIKSRFGPGFCLLCTSHGPCCLSPCHQVWEIWLYWILSALCGGIWVAAGKKSATCRTCGKTFPRPNVTLSDFLPAKSERKKGNRSRNSSPALSRRSRNTSPAMSRMSSVVSWSDSPREQSEPNGEDAVMEDCTETDQAEIDKKIKPNDKLRKILTNMPEEHRALIYGESCSRRMQSLDDEKAALLAAKRQFLPLQSRIKRTKELSGARLERDRIEAEKTFGNFAKNGQRLIRNWKQPIPNRYKPNMRWRFWWVNRLQKMGKLSINEIQGFRLTRQDPFLIKLHNKPFSQCSNPFSRCKAFGTAEEDVKNQSGKGTDSAETRNTKRGP